MQSHNFTIATEDAGTRLDVFLADQQNPPLSRSQVRKHLDAGDILVNDQPVKSGYKLRTGDRIALNHQPPQPIVLIPQNIPLSILYQDDLLAIVDKPAGLVVHPAPGHPDQTLVNALLFHFDGQLGRTQITENSENTNKNSETARLRPGIVHRLDKDTSGAMVVAKNDATYQHLAQQFRAHTTIRTYHALVFGPGLPDSGTINTPHARDPNNRKRFSANLPSDRHAITHYTVLERFSSGAALVQCQLETGRTHQIRMHLNHLDASILGDTLYGGPRTARTPLIQRQALHAVHLEITHPDNTPLQADAPYPPDFLHALTALRAHKDWR